MPTASAERFPAKWAYTVDGGELGELECENFNAASATVRITGNNVHPGTAKGSMINSQTLAARFHAAMPAEQTPECTQGKRGLLPPGPDGGLGGGDHPAPPHPRLRR